MKEFLEILVEVSTMTVITLFGLLIIVSPILIWKGERSDKWLILIFITFPLGISLIVYLVQLCGY